MGYFFYFAEEIIIIYFSVLDAPRERKDDTKKNADLTSSPSPSQILKNVMRLAGHTAHVVIIPSHQNVSAHTPRSAPRIFDFPV